MSTNNSNDWVREGTPREDWDADTDYGVEVDPAEWDDYAQEQAVPVRTPEAARDYVPPTQQEPQPEPEQPVEQEQVAGEDAPDVPQPDAATPTVDESPEAETQPEAVQPEPHTERDDVPPVEEPVAEDRPVAEHPAEESPTEASPVEHSQVDEAPEGTSPVDEFQGSYETADDEHTTVRPRPIVPETAAEQPESITDTAEHRPADEDPQATAVYDVVDRDDAQPEDATPLESETQPEPEPEPRDDHAEGDAAAAAAPLAAGAVATDSADNSGHDDGEYASLYREEDQKLEPESAVEPEPEAETTQAFTPPMDDNTQVLDNERLAAEEAEERERQARLQEQRDARDARLGVVASSQDAGVRVVTKPVKRQADKFFGAFSLFVLRGVLAAILGVLAYQVLQDVTRTEEFIANTVVPEPRLVAWILGYGLAVLAALLLIGLGARFFSVLLVLISGASLALFRWGAFSIFMDGREGFLGDRTLLTLAAALVIVAFGAGRWSIDGAIYSARQKSKETIDG